jgi:hypothetical protein
MSYQEIYKQLLDLQTFFEEELQKNIDLATAPNYDEPKDRIDEFNSLYIS